MAPAEVGTAMRGWGFEVQLLPLACAVHPAKPQAHWKRQLEGIQTSKKWLSPPTPLPLPQWQVLGNACTVGYI